MWFIFIRSIMDFDSFTLHQARAVLNAHDNDDYSEQYDTLHALFPRMQDVALCALLDELRAPSSRFCAMCGEHHASNVECE